MYHHTLVRIYTLFNQEGYSVERIPPPCNAWSTRTYRAQYIFEISCWGPEFKSCLAVELIPDGVDSACHPSEVSKMSTILLGWLSNLSILHWSNDLSRIVPNNRGDCFGSTNALYRVWTQWILDVVFGPISQWWRITLKILVARSGSSPKCNQFILVTHPTSPQNFIQIHPQLFEISCTQTDKQTDRQGWKHDILPASVAEVIIAPTMSTDTRSFDEAIYPIMSVIHEHHMN